MKHIYFYASLILLLSLTACGGNDERLETASVDPIRWGVEPQDTTSPSETDEGQQAEGESEEAQTYDSEKVILNDVGRFNGHYSKFKTLNLDECVIIERNAESSDKTYECCDDMPMAVYVREGDGRYTIRLGGNSDYFLGGQPFNSIGGTLEWRYNGVNEIVAVIARHTYQSGALDRLVVIRPPSTNGGSCYVQLVPADAQPSQNAKARQIADNINQYECL